MKGIQRVLLLLGLCLVAHQCCVVLAVPDSDSETLSPSDSIAIAEVQEPLSPTLSSVSGDTNGRFLQRRPPPPPPRRPYYPPRPVYRYPPPPPPVRYPPPPPPVRYPPPPPVYRYPPPPPVYRYPPPPPVYGYPPRVPPYRPPYPPRYGPHPPPPRVGPYYRHLQKLSVSNPSDYDNEEYDPTAPGDSVNFDEDAPNVLEGLASSDAPIEEKSGLTGEYASEDTRQLFMKYSKLYPVPVPYPVYRPYYYRPPMPAYYAPYYNMYRYNTRGYWPYY